MTTTMPVMDRAAARFDAPARFILACTTGRLVLLLLLALVPGGPAARAVVVETIVPGGGITVTASSTFSPQQDPRHLVDGGPAQTVELPVFGASTLHLETSP